MKEDHPFPEHIYVYEEDFGDEQLTLVAVRGEENAIQKFNDMDGELIAHYKLEAVSQVRVHVGLDGTKVAR